MEEITQILNSIKKHTEKEAELHMTNRTIGRAYVRFNGKQNKTIWIANAFPRAEYATYVDRKGNVQSYTNSSNHTYMNDGDVISKNSTWGRILLTEHDGSHKQLIRSTLISMDILLSIHLRFL